MNKFMWKNMKEINNSHRPEQMLLYKILKQRDYIKDGSYTIETEYEVTDLKPTMGLPSKGCIIDIVLINSQYSRMPYGEGTRVAIRINGGIHKGGKYKRRTRIKLKDKDQEILLRANGWDVRDVDKEKFPELWERPNLSETTWSNLVRDRLRL